MGNKGDLIMTSLVKWYPGQNSTRRTLHSISMKICEVHLGIDLLTKKIVRHHNKWKYKNNNNLCHVCRDVSNKYISAEVFKHRKIQKAGGQTWCWLSGQGGGLGSLGPEF